MCVDLLNIYLINKAQIVPAEQSVFAPGKQELSPDSHPAEKTRMFKNKQLNNLMACERYYIYFLIVCYQTAGVHNSTGDGNQ